MFESIPKDVHCLGARFLVLKFDKSKDQANFAPSTPNAYETISNEPKDENQAYVGFSTPTADEIDDITTKPEDEGNTGTTTSEFDNDIISTKQKNECQANAGSSTHKVDDNAVSSTRPKYRGGPDTNLVLRQAGLVPKETKEASLVESGFLLLPPIKRSERVAKRLKF
ncbi:uncharacterized protein N7500_006681 [Penicillium coprophilum]|uniref:uncharacterized protein n=1 Tax=Penicillium coprophilum TaxID=36646 RepID=UPI0023969185|nr:uncharacterized protein N7500_006681 [Penicillium coprophilum]KAJ5164851.1 hypothetical protein N7500_006681 [Penicillium coprophilum]